VASISKPVTATAVLCLVEDGLLELDRSVQKYIAEFTGDGKEAVTVRHLLTHTSGLRDEAVYAHVGRKREAGPNPPDERTEPASLTLFPPYVCTGISNRGSTRRSAERLAMSGLLELRLRAPG